MGWDQQTARQDVQGFLLDLLGIDAQEVIRNLIEFKLSESCISYSVEEDIDREESCSHSGSFHPRRIVFSDGRTFVETLLEEVSGDSWGTEFYGFVEAGKSYKILRVFYNGPDDEPEISEEIVPGDDAVPASLEEIREQGNSLSPGMGDSIADFFASQGVTKIEWK